MSAHQLLSLSGQSHLVTRCSVSARIRVPFGWTVRLLEVWPLGHPEMARPYWPLFDYLKAHPTLSDQSQRIACRGMGFFWDYSQVACPNLDQDLPIITQHRQLLRDFGVALIDGTITNNTDPLGLFWPSQQPELVARLLTAIEDFANWQFKESGQRNPFKRTPTAEERMVDSIVAVTRKNVSLLGYLDESTGGRSPFVQLPRGNETDNTLLCGPLSFPPAQVENTLWEGFKRDKAKNGPFGEYQVREMMIFLLQVFAGLREHEPFHLWATDVVEDPVNPGSASVFLYHPAQGLAFLEGPDGVAIRCTRQQKLLHDYGLPPRNLGVGSYHVGWKNSLVGTKDKYVCLGWSDPLAAQLFWELYLVYLPTRHSLMRRRVALGYREHPFLFVSTQSNRNTENGVSAIGAPAGIGQYERALRRAVVRCGMTPSKQNGTSSQALRHLYANTLKREGFGPVFLQTALRHRDVNSQERYGRPTPGQVNTALQAIHEDSQHADEVGWPRASVSNILDGLTERYPPHVRRAL
ncbi:hypothetical protein PQR33_32850 [Paraburkholderia sediminicola]|uniref:hypothetical protein n=1 Tax=Paraburkholderia sediminicola TaxID=458836 RepID=UPI0038B7748A